MPLGKAAPDILREHASECAGNEVRRQVDVHVGSDWKRVGAARVSGTLSLDRRAGAEAVLDGVATSVVFSVEVLSPSRQPTTSTSRSPPLAATLTP